MRCKHFSRSENTSGAVGGSAPKFADAYLHRDGYPEIDVTELSSHTDKRIIDVREPNEFRGELGHIPGAELVPLATIEQAAATWDRNEPLIVVCRSGGRSSRAVATLQQLGFRCAANLRGGMLSYRAVERTQGALA